MRNILRLTQRVHMHFLHVQNFVVGVSLARDRSGINAGYLNQQMRASINLTIDSGYDFNITENLLLLIICHWDKVVNISGNREVEITE